ncbi:MAG TPA: hypothetical protein VMZ51_08020 [Acidimicrobiales bacterium]|nr:hypothetical protein [Acidimicrobiales bacterium]
MSDERIEVLRGALDVLDKQGWSQGFYTNPDGSHCLAGAINTAGMAMSSYSILDAKNALALKNIEEWNDAPERTVEDVKQLLKQAIYDLENEAGS